MSETVADHVLAYPSTVHEVLHGRPRTGRFHVHGCLEEDTTTTPFDLLASNRMTRHDLAADAILRADGWSSRPTHVDARVRALLENAASLAPLHMPQALALLDFVGERLPAIPQVVCPDTAFHRDLPDRARRKAGEHAGDCARRCARWPAAAASTPRWASPRGKAW